MLPQRIDVTGPTPPSAITARRLSLLLLVLCALMGCKHKGAYHASKLPPEYNAPQVHSARHLDLSRLSQSSRRNEVVYKGDLLKVSVATGLESMETPTWLLRIDESGNVQVPLVGEVQIGGLELAAAEAAIHQASIKRDIYRSPQVSVTVEHRKSNQITILGAVTNEGTYELPSNQSDVLAALVAAGGLAADADTVIEVRSPHGDGLASIPSADGNTPGVETAAASGTKDTEGRVELAQYSPAPPASGQSLRINLATAPPAAANYHVSDGSVVMVMRRPKHTLQVIGLVKQPGQFELPVDQDVRLLDAVALAGGLTTELADKVLVVRNSAGGRQAIMIKASLDDAKRNHLENMRLAPGDVISVEETALTYVTSELQKYFRFSISAASGLAFF